MKTEKLYYNDAYIKEFDAKVISCKKCGTGYAAVLDRTAFFPCEGGQSADTGSIDGVEVVDVRENDGVIEHILVSEIAVGKEAHCKLNFDERLEKMQLHTAEHIICGVIHSLYGFDNVGFHIGKDDVTFDINAVLDREMLDKAEKIANRAVFENVSVRAFFPTQEELPLLEYRSKLDITEDVRIVNIEGYDSCACCAPHVARTGEIGLIKLLEFEKHRGGTRIHLVAGARALADYREKYRNIESISASLSFPQHETAEALKNYMTSVEKTEQKLKSALLAVARLEAEKIEKTEGNIVGYFSELGINEAREFVNLCLSKAKGAVVGIVGEENNYKYVMSSNKEDIIKLTREANLALCGKGGGRPPMTQGSFATTLDKIFEFFEKRK